ncbi:NACHT domain-containing protein [Catellatospora tritici]|uniref:NACHT domain-containing protein n=1 Tax=Catellatospora tritici TaxID=2851566 RepID=UPI001C2DA27F|nr:NACHT domain-containing protein [Catellatospora tritici]MBV1855614.1 NACHT domain-containing protein [Catellatospora tritici]
MSGIEIAAIGLGTQVARIACGVWVADESLSGQIGSSLIDVVSQRLTSTREQRQFRRVWEQAAELVADRIEPLIHAEFRRLDEGERIAVIDAVAATFRAASLNEADLFARDLDAGYLDRHVRSQDPGRVDRAGLVQDGTALYSLLLRECCAYVIEIVRTLPQAGIVALTEVLRRERQVLDDLRTVLERLPARRGLDDFERDYRQLVANQLDRVEFFGATLSESSRRYPLSVAYLSMSMSGDFTFPSEEPTSPERGMSTASSATVDTVLADRRRLFVRGQAGIGKTTLLQWIAVQSARSNFSGQLNGWNNTVPFFIPLRRFATGDLPGPERFVADLGRHIVAEMPGDWAHAQLRAGRAVVLIDGVDELAEDLRQEVRTWLSALVGTFPEARYVITSRPAAAPADWLDHDGFTVAEMEPMSRSDVPVFVRRWHDAMRDQSAGADERAELDRCEANLLQELTTQRHLRQLAGYPLLCALLCALHRDRRGHLPTNRMELYDVALQMLLDRRDHERRINHGPTLSRTDKMLLLRDIAYWLIRNNWLSTSAARVEERIETKLRSMGHITSSAAEVYQALVERSGLIREPVDGQTDFVHRTFQDYLAAAEAVAQGDIGALIANASTDLWSEMVIMASGHATFGQREQLLNGLIELAGGERDRHQGDSLRLLALASLETAPELSPGLRTLIGATAEALIPPRTMAAAESVAGSGDLALDLLLRSTPRRAVEAAATVRALARIADPAALDLLAHLAKGVSRSVFDEIVSAWSSFDAEVYARVVLRDSPLEPAFGGHLRVSRAEHFRAARHLRNLCGLTYDGNEVPDFAILGQLPQLRFLQMPNSVIDDIEVLRGASIEELNVFGGSDEAMHPLDVSRASEVANLRRLTSLHRQCRSRAALPPSIVDVSLFDPSRDMLEVLQDSTDLEALRLRHARGLKDLRSLYFLTNPLRIGLQYCMNLADISSVGRWASSLIVLELLGSYSFDLGPLAELHQLRTLYVNSDLLDKISPVRLRALESLDILADHAELDLGTVNFPPQLRRVRIFGTLAELRLGRLAHRPDVTVSVARKVRMISPRGHLCRITRW